MLSSLQRIFEHNIAVRTLDILLDKAFLDTSLRGDA